MVDYKGFACEYNDKEISKNFDRIMETKNIYAGLEYLLVRAGTIKENQITSMIKSELKKGGEG